MNIVFRVDSSVEIGTGHVMRCLTLANQLRLAGANITFICRKLPGDLVSYIRSFGINVEEILKNEDDLDKMKVILDSHNLKVDLLIVDHYAIDVEWESKIRPLVNKIMVIDDLANRKHDCDILLDQNYYIDIDSRYDELVPKECVLLLGPNYLLLRDEFREAAKNMTTRTGEVKNILVFLGGSDSTNETKKVLLAIDQLSRKNDIFINVVVGNSNPNKHEIKMICKNTTNTTFHCQINYMAKLMSVTDLTIGAGGATTWERCFLKLPSISIILAENQREITNAVAIKGATMNLGEWDRVTPQDILKALEFSLDNPKYIKEMAEHCGEIIDSKNTNIGNIIRKIQEVIS